MRAAPPGARRCLIAPSAPLLYRCGPHGRAPLCCAAPPEQPPTVCLLIRTSCKLYDEPMVANQPGLGSEERGWAAAARLERARSSAHSRRAAAGDAWGFERPEPRRLVQGFGFEQEQPRPANGARAAPSNKQPRAQAPPTPWHALPARRDGANATDPAPARAAAPERVGSVLTTRPGCAQARQPPIMIRGQALAAGVLVALLLAGEWAAAGAADSCAARRAGQRRAGQADRSLLVVAVAAAGCLTNKAVALPASLPSRAAAGAAPRGAVRGCRRRQLPSPLPPHVQAMRPRRFSQTCR